MRIAAGSSVLLPSDNEWGVPCLLPDLQPRAVVAPVVRWGSIARRTKHGGTTCMYTDDYRYGRDATMAARIAATVPAAAVEPNYSVLSWTPRAEVLVSIYRKRRVARELQELGVPVFVDLCVPRDHFDLALLGVPKGWRAYATRGFSERAEEVAEEYELAASHAGGTPLFLVYAGGSKVEEIARGLPGAVFVGAELIQPRSSGVAGHLPDAAQKRSAEYGQSNKEEKGR